MYYRDVKDLIRESQETEGIDIKKLKPGTLVEVWTRNSKYELKINDDSTTIKGGKHFLEETPIVFTGSTWGGSCIKVGWIGLGMHMELWQGDLVTTTTGARKAKVSGDGWEYELDWSDHEGGESMPDGS